MCPLSRRDLFATALSLPPNECAILADALLQSLEPIDPDIERAWLDEVKRRLAAFEAGETEAIPAEEVFAELEREMDGP